MAVTYKDINQLTQKSSVTGAEKLPVSSTQYVTIDQIVGLVDVPTKTSDLNNDSGFRKITVSTSEPTSSDGSNGDVWIVI